METLRSNILFVQSRFEELLEKSLDGPEESEEEDRVSVIEQFSNSDSEAYITEEPEPKNSPDTYSWDKEKNRVHQEPLRDIETKGDNSERQVGKTGDAKSEADRVICDICGQTFGKYRIKAHRETHIPIEQRELAFKCQLCDKGFTEKRNLKQHMLTHERTKAEPCPICEKKYYNLKRHMNKVHKERKKLTCHLCGAQVLSMHSHMKYKHTESDELPCEYCGKTFTMKRTLLRHMRIHLGIKEQCPFCPFQSSHGNLMTHIKGQHPDRYENFKKEKEIQPRPKRVA